jgi:hypothetical protein
MLNWDEYHEDDGHRWRTGRRPKRHRPGTNQRHQRLRPPHRETVAEAAALLSE